MDNKSIYQFKVKDIRGNDVSLADYKGKVLMIVNTASECGFTPQLKELEQLREEFKEDGFEVLGFPCNQFGGQEPLEGEQIENFCSINYGVDFPIFDKVDVKGEEASELFKFFGDKKMNGKISSVPKWNFHKYLIDRNGHVVDYYYSITKPGAGRVTKAIKKLLAVEA